MRMPDMTVCAATPYKTPGFHFNHVSIPLVPGRIVQKKY